MHRTKQYTNKTSKDTRKLKGYFHRGPGPSDSDKSKITWNRNFLYKYLSLWLDSEVYFKPHIEVKQRIVSDV